MLRGGAVPVVVADERPSRGSVRDVVVVDGRFGLAEAVAQVEQLRSLDATIGIFFVAADSSPDAILPSMRAGANEFFAWPPSREALDEGVEAHRRAAARPRRRRSRRRRRWCSSAPRAAPARRPWR